MNRTAAVVALLLTPVFLLALRLPGLGAGQAVLTLPGEAVLDYTRLPAGFEPLSAAYLSRLFGHPLEEAFASNLDLPGSGATTDTPVTAREVRHDEVSDSFAEAVPITNVPFEGTGNTRRTTREDGEPASCGRVGGTAWYRYRPSADSELIANTFGSSYPTTLGVFQGESLDSLELVGCDSDARGNSFLSFDAKAHRAYYFQIAGPLGGSLRFLLEPFPEVVLASTGPTDDEVGDSHMPSVSRNGRYVAFVSAAPLTARAHDGCACTQIFVRDLRKGTTRLVSVTPHGGGGNARSSQPAISANGRYVVFQSFASDLVPRDTNRITDIFLRDLVRNTTVRVSVTPEGEQAEARWPPGAEATDEGTSPYHHNRTPVISAEGDVIAFLTQSPNLSGDHRNCVGHCNMIVVVDRSRGTLENACVRPDGQIQNHVTCYLGSISTTGRYLVFESTASDLVPDDQNGVADVFIRDLKAGETTLVSENLEGRTGNNRSNVYDPLWHNGKRHVSRDGRWVVFSSLASDLVDADSANTVDTFVRDRSMGVTIRVTPPAASATNSTYASSPPDDTSISDDGRIVVFSGDGQYLSEDDNAHPDIYVRNLATGFLYRLSFDEQGSSTGAREPSISPDGSRIAFSSFWPYTPDDGDTERDVFVRALPAGVL